MRFENLDIIMPKSHLSGSVLLGFHNELRVQARAEADLSDLERIERFAVAGKGILSCEIHGVFQEPHLSGHAHLSAFEFGGMRLGDLDTDVVLDPDGLGVTFPTAVFTKGESKYIANRLYLDFRKGRFSLSSTIELARLKLGDFYHVFGFEEDERFRPYEGVVKGKALLQYTNGFPGDSPSGTLLVDSVLDVEWASLNGYRFEKGKMLGKWVWRDWSKGYRGGELVVEKGMLQKGDGEVAFYGTMKEGGIVEFIVGGERIPIKAIEGIGDRWPSVEGEVEVIARASGPADQMVVDADLVLTKMGYAGRRLGDGRLYVRMTYDNDPWVQVTRGWEFERAPHEEACLYGRKGLATANWPEDPPIRTVDGWQRPLERPSAFIVCGNLLDGAVDIDLAIGRQSTYPIRGKVWIDELDLDRLLRGREEGVTQAWVKGSLDFLDGGIKDLPSLRGLAKLEEVVIERREAQIRSSQPILVAFNSGRLTIQQAL
ncbi:MAG: hypothetical protein NZM37_13195, partial [Sandaracinaceae bacterium]|nr:hypothetical protein [Sandaracinaceae bacterium]